GLKRLLELVPAEQIGYEACGSWDLLESNEHISSDFLAYLNKEIQKITGLSSCYTADHEMLKKSGLHGFNFAFKNLLEGSIQTDQLIDSLHASCITKGIKFLFGTTVKEIDSGEILTPFGTFKANQIVVCTNGFASQLLPLSVTPARAQVLVTTPIEDLAIHGTFHFDDGYYYFRNVGNRVLFGGGRNLDFTGEQTASMEHTPRIQNHLISLLQTNILPGKTFDIAYQWAGTMGLGSSKKPIIERIDCHTVVGVRMGGMGVAIGALVGEKLSNMVMNE
ncbi:MAG: NAD(P)/FAD-dependent oxidoreductase, partial [Flavobacteriales bacterium]